MGHFRDERDLPPHYLRLDGGILEAKVNSLRIICGWRLRFGGKRDLFPALFEVGGRVLEALTTPLICGLMGAF